MGQKRMGRRHRRTGQAEVKRINAALTRALSPRFFEVKERAA